MKRAFVHLKMDINDSVLRLYILTSNYSDRGMNRFPGGSSNEGANFRKREKAPSQPGQPAGLITGILARPLQNEFKIHGRRSREDIIII